MEITLASVKDIAGIRLLIDENNIDRIKEKERPGGFLSTNMTDAMIEALIDRERGITVAKTGSRVLAFVMAASWAAWKESPLLARISEKLSEFPLEGTILTVENSYHYGPVCVDRSVRGSGVFERVFFASLAHMRRRYQAAATFINRINARSYAAHTRKAGMTRIGAFEFGGNEYYLLARFTAAE